MKIFFLMRVLPHPYLRQGKVGVGWGGQGCGMGRMRVGISTEIGLGGSGGGEGGRGGLQSHRARDCARLAPRSWPFFISAFKK